MGGGFVAMYLYAPITEDVKILVIGCMVFFPLLMIVGIPTVDALMTIHNSMHWKGHLRFRFDPQSDELFFPRENATYSVQDGIKLVFGCVRGVDMTSAYKTRLGGWACKAGGKGIHFPHITQIFMLVFAKNGEWRRHNLTNDWIVNWTDSGSKEFLEIAEKLQPLLECEVFVKDYSKDECFEQQNSTTH